MKILGISSGFHDAAAALVVEGYITAAVEEERLTRVKHDSSFPSGAMDACLAIGGLNPEEVDLIACHEKPLDVVNRHLASKVRGGPRSLGSLLTTTPKVIASQLGLGARISRWFRERGVRCPPVHFVPHHVSHAAAAFYPSPFSSAAVITVDGVGEWSTSTLGFGHGRRLRVDRELRYPDSAGLLYSAFTSYCGMAVNSGEGELMGLAPYGEPTYIDRIFDELLTLDRDGSLRLNQRYFDYVGGGSMTSSRFHELFGGPPKPVGSAPTGREADLAASVQQAIEQVVLRMASQAQRDTGAENLCISGGVALNCVANGRVRSDGPFREVWVQPSPGDAGSALGAALWSWHEGCEEPREPVVGEVSDRMRGSFLGPRFSDAEVAEWVSREAIPSRRVADRAELCRVVANRLAEGALVGWFVGRMEFGPRALGHRSILADPRSMPNRGRLNEAIKERAGFRPFAPAVLAEHSRDWFELSGESPFMTFASTIAAQRWLGPSTPDRTAELGEPSTELSEVPAVTHVDRSARVQTVDAERNPELAMLLGAWNELTQCPMLLNTSFNGRAEPIVCTPDDALATFRRTGLDLLVVEDHLIEAGA